MLDSAVFAFDHSNPALEKISSEFTNSTPYKHLVLDNVFNDSLLRNVRKEVLENLHASMKETDIYKVWQTGDLANIDGLDEKERNQLENLLKLRNSLYSEEFRGFISSVTGCGELSGTQFDLSANIYKQGGHLICHDDVIGTRRVSYIIYLTDPDDSKTWGEDSESSPGGELELYALRKDEQGNLINEPESAPVKTHKPLWNRLILFPVVPGASFHAVREVLKLNKPRVSISGWFHIPEGEKMNVDPQSSLEQIMSSTDDFEGLEYQRYENLSDGDEIVLTESDVKYLSKYLNPTYLKGNILGQIAASLAEQGSLQLHKFLKADFAKKLVTACNSSDKADGLLEKANELNPQIQYEAGVKKGWKIAGAPHKFRFAKLDSASEFEKVTDISKECVLLQEVRCLMQSESFGRFLSALSQVAVIARRGLVRRFRPGLDYTLALGKDEEDSTKVVIEATWTHVYKDEFWASGDMGGYVCFMNPDDKNDDAAVYRGMDENEDDDTMSVNPISNGLSLVIRGADSMRFVKYVSRQAPGSRWEASFEYLVENMEQ
jgi:Rps23 Pro-64 3,4-dihydroxylase Tpa1-like proline 4-hydroxylase